MCFYSSVVTVVIRPIPTARSTQLSEEKPQSVITVRWEGQWNISAERASFTDIFFNLFLTFVLKKVPKRSLIHGVFSGIVCRCIMMNPDMLACAPLLLFSNG